MKDPNAGPMAEQNAPDFFGDPTQAKRIAKGGRTEAEEPTGPPIAHTPMPHTDPHT